MLRHSFCALNSRSWRIFAFPFSEPSFIGFTIKVNIALLLLSVVDDHSRRYHFLINKLLCNRFSDGLAEQKIHHRLQWKLVSVSLKFESHESVEQMFSFHQSSHEIDDKEFICWRFWQLQMHIKEFIRRDWRIDKSLWWGLKQFQNGFKNENLSSEIPLPATPSKQVIVAEPKESE